VQSFYDRVGGAEVFEKLVGHFYQGVANDPILKPMYPEEDLGPAERRLRMFLEQYWGGPDTYQKERGHPRLRMRHAPFPIGPRAREAWLGHMRSAVDKLELAPADEAELWDYLERAAHAMLNTFSD
jgi:hemoglobin